ncbi:MAG: NAD-dependent epimerase/dehydratase family protein [Desulfobulbaceae bacterium]|nr:NAD-dependent epimerase/dehydratase family protein [Desulfobulbaceae bacterium]
METRQQNSSRRLGVLIGGSGLIGGTLMHYFKTRANDDIELLAPNSKRLSLREPEDIRRYFLRYRPDFIVNCAIAAIDSDPKFACEVNYLGAVNLARAALAFNIPYIHFSTAAVLPSGENLGEEEHLPLTADLANYAKSKLMAELTLRHLREQQGLDYTCIRLGVVYGEHDHKIQGFSRLLFSVADQAMPVLLTKPGVMHSYSNAAKLPFFVHHLLDRRQEFSGQTYHFVDRNPVELAQLILTIKAYLELKTPREIYLPIGLAQASRGLMRRLVHLLGRIGIKAREPKELIFLENFYKSQALAADKLARSSFVDPNPSATIYSEIPALIQYYLTRWEQLNLLSSYNKEFFDPNHRAEEFLRTPELLLAAVHHESSAPWQEFDTP